MLADDDAVWELMMGESDGDDDEDEDEAPQVSPHMYPTVDQRRKGDWRTHTIDLCTLLLESVSDVTFSLQDGAGAEGAPPEAGAEAVAGGDAAAAGVSGDAIAAVPMVRILNPNELAIFTLAMLAWFTVSSGFCDLHLMHRVEYRRCIPEVVEENVLSRITSCSSLHAPLYTPCNVCSNYKALEIGEHSSASTSVASWSALMAYSYCVSSFALVQDEDAEATVQP